MKFNKFLDNIDYKLMYEVGINLFTLKKIITLMKNNLSPIESVKYQLKVDKILSYINKQIKIDDFLKLNEINECQKELDKLNGKPK